MEAGTTTFDAICLAFAQIVDAKSPFTYNRSNGVANAAVAIARMLGFEPARVLFLRHAALLHDIGKLSGSNAILEKPGKPDAAEWEVLRLHPFYTWKILQGIPGFVEMSEIAASHHEKLDGSGYLRGLSAPQLPLEARIWSSRISLTPSPLSDRTVMRCLWKRHFKLCEKIRPMPSTRAASKPSSNPELGAIRPLSICKL